MWSGLSRTRLGTLATVWLCSHYSHPAHVHVQECIKTTFLWATHTNRATLVQKSCYYCWPVRTVIGLDDTCGTDNNKIIIMQNIPFWISNHNINGIKALPFANISLKYAVHIKQTAVLLQLLLFSHVFIMHTITCELLHLTVSHRGSAPHRLLNQSGPAN